MNYTTLISPEALNHQLHNSHVVIVDCRFSLANAEAGAASYRHGHIPQARYAHLDNDLSSAITSLTGRHPLPNMTAFVKKLGVWGIDNQSQVIAYDDAGGAFAGRLWWLLRTLGHDKAAVLDGGYRRWLTLGYAVTTRLPVVTAKTFRPYPADTDKLSALDVQNGLARKNLCLIDARTPERYRGEQEPIDPVAGHIPGALNRPFQLNLDNNGLFLPAEILRKQFGALIGATSPDRTVHMCGSGVTACHNLLAMEIAGLKGSKLYPGSWSEWIRDKNRPVAQRK